MRHASEKILDTLEDLLEKVRQIPMVKERKRGTFYLKSEAFVHFHEDPAGVFADLKIGNEWERLRVSSKAEQKAFLRRLTSLHATRDGFAGQ